MKTSMKTAGLGAVMAAGFFMMAAVLSYGDDKNPITKSFKVDPGGRLVLETNIGSIDVRGTEGGTVEIKVNREVRSGEEEKTLSDFKLNFEQRGNDVSVTGEYKRYSFLSFLDHIRNRLKVQFVITVPKAYNVDLKTSGGSITVADLTGHVVSKTSGGSLSYDHIGGDIDGRTSGGHIRAGFVDGRIDVRTSGGSIDIEETKGDVLAKTSGGGIRVSKAESDVDVDTSGGSIHVEEVKGALVAATSGGSISASFSGQPRSRCELATSGGSITAYLGETAAVDIDARSFGGSVSTEFPVTIRGEMRRSSLQGQINGGGPEINLRTSGGSIHIKKK